MKRFACHYAIARFLPYVDGGEFVNIGVIICCPDTGFLDFQLETKKRKRVTNFFPEFPLDFYREGLKAWSEELRRIHLAPKNEQETAAYFAEAVKAKATSFKFGPVGSILTSDPQQELNALFDRYVLRQYEDAKDQPEIMLRRELSNILRANNLNTFYAEKRIGGEDLPTALPFVYWPNDMARPLKAMKPLHLDKTTTGDIYEHVDFWLQRIKRLRKKNLWPEETLFALKAPTQGGKFQEAYSEVVSDLKGLEIEVESFSETKAILAFAQNGLVEQMPISDFS